MHGLVGLDVGQLRHLDAALVADPAEVIASQVDDRHVLRAALRILVQRPGEGAILGGTRPAPARSLDRPRFGPAPPVDNQETLGG